MNFVVDGQVFYCVKGSLSHGDVLLSSSLFESQLMTVSPSSLIFYTNIPSIPFMILSFSIAGISSELTFVIFFLIKLMRSSFVVLLPYKSLYKFSGCIIVSFPKMLYNTS